MKVGWDVEQRESWPELWVRAAAPPRRAVSQSLTSCPPHGQRLCDPELFSSTPFGLHDRAEMLFSSFASPLTEETVVGA